MTAHHFRPPSHLFDVEVDDPRQLLLPDPQPVQVDVVLDVLEGASEAVHPATQLLQLRRQLPGLQGGGGDGSIAGR